MIDCYEIVDHILPQHGDFSGEDFLLDRHSTNLSIHKKNQIFAVISIFFLAIIHKTILQIFSLTLPIRTTTGLRCIVVQCAAVNMKKLEIIVPPQSKLILYCSFRYPNATFTKIERIQYVHCSI